MEIQIIRKYNEQATNGILFLDGKKIGYTIELPWKNNMRRVSCIPEGIYKVKKRYTSRFGWHLLVEDVPNRDMILVHAFNDAVKESKGCIAPVAMVTGYGKGTLSRSSLKRLMELLDPVFRQLKPVYLTIKKQQDECTNKKSTGANTAVL